MILKYRDEQPDSTATQWAYVDGVSKCAVDENRQISTEPVARIICLYKGDEHRHFLTVASKEAYLLNDRGQTIERLA